MSPATTTLPPGTLLVVGGAGVTGHWVAEHLGPLAPLGGVSTSHGATPSHIVIADTDPDVEFRLPPVRPGGPTVEAVHLPGHTRGHSGFRMDGVFFLSDIDLTGFGPYYGDVWSDLEDFEASLAKVRDEVADYYVTFHHKGVIEGRETFVRMVDEFTSVIGRRHDAMLDFLREPHSIDEMSRHRFIYRPHIELAFVEFVERRSAELHVQRMLRRGEALEVSPGIYQST